MNFNPELTSESAVLFSLFAAFMWGSWFVSLKNIGDYPLDGFYVTLFTTSFVLVWSVGLILDGPALVQNIQDVFASDPLRVFVSLGAGMTYVIGMRITLYVMQTIGLSLSQPILHSFGVLIGVAVTTIIGGTPEGFSLVRTLIAVLFFLIAIFLSMIAARLRTRAQEANAIQSSLVFTMRDVWKAIGAILIVLPFRPAYTLGLSYGLASITHAEGLAVLPYMALLVTGAFTGSMIGSGGILTYRKQWGLVFRAPFKIHKWGIMSGLAHYGGNIIHTFGTAFLSAAVSFPLGLTSGLWTQFWGIVYGEYKGVEKRIYAVLGAAILAYIIGAFLVASQTF